MKKIFTLTLCVLLFSFAAFAGKLVFIPVNKTQNLETLFSNNDLKIHYYCDDYVLATTENLNIEGTVLLDEHAFADGKQYAIVYCYEDTKDAYLSRTNKSGKLLYSGNDFLIMNVLSSEFVPAKNDGMVAIRDIQARLPRAGIVYPVITEPDETILSILAQVSTDSVMSYIQTLQDFVTRNCRHPNIVNSRNWLKTKFETFGLEVTLHNFPYYNNDNVIAIQRGTEFPDEYVVCGAHYDSFTYESHIDGSYDNATGADDNASGTAGILEAARILSQYDLKRSVIYCAFSGEEYGLYGSSYFAEKCVKEKMNIIGYFNLDMIGFLKEGEDIRMDYIFPSTAKPLADYSINICDVYLPEIPVRQFTSLPWGDSDHTSFNRVGYKGVWPFEDIICDSPYIHHVPGADGCSTPCLGDVPCLGDIIGPSVNNPKQVSVFTQANLACVATLAFYNQGMPPPSAPPTNCVADIYNNTQIRIKWQAPVGESPEGYYIYRDGIKIYNGLINTLSFFDKVNDHNNHCYAFIASYGIFESDFSNESCASLPNAITEFNSNFHIYPNPATNELRIEVAGQARNDVQSVEIFDVYGIKFPFNKLKRWTAKPDGGGKEDWQPQADGITINISHLPAGIYFVKIHTEKGIVNAKVVKM